jgi:hypothetical protein
MVMIKCDKCGFRHSAANFFPTLNPDFLQCPACRNMCRKGAPHPAGKREETKREAEDHGRAESEV